MTSRAGFTRRRWAWAAACSALAGSACGPEAGGDDCEPGALGVVEVRTADDVAALARVEAIAELHVVDSDLVDLSGFECLRQAEKIHVERNGLLESLDGLEGLVEVVGRLDEPRENFGAEFVIRDNDVLADLSPLSSLRAVEGTFEISRNSELVEIVDLGALEIAGRELVISENRALEIVGGLDTFTGGLHEGDSSGGFVRINDNPALRAIAFPPIPLKAEGLEIQRNPRLADLSMHLLCSPFWYTISDSPALPSLPVSVRDLSQESLLCSDRTIAYAVSGVPSLTDMTALPRAVGLATLEIRDNAGLARLDGLQDLQQVEELLIEGNPRLGSLAGLDPAMGGGLERVESRFSVQNNPTLDQCAVGDFADVLLAESQSLSVEIAGNGGACQ
jgi:hypothetical protein